MDPSSKTGAVASPGLANLKTGGIVGLSLRSGCVVDRNLKTGVSLVLV